MYTAERQTFDGPKKWLVLAGAVILAYGLFLWIIGQSAKEREYRDGLTLAQCTATDGVFYKPSPDSDPICLKKDAVLVMPPTVEP